MPPEMLYNWAVDMSGPFDLVIFDCDGVLADTETLDNQVVSVLLEEAGHTIALEEIAARASGLTDDAMLTLVEKELGHPLPEGIRDRRESMLLETFRQSLTPTPGLQEAVRQLSAKNVTLCVASNGRLEKVAAILDIICLADQFGGRIFSADMVARAKPCPDLFLYAAQQLRTAPYRCVVVEDSRVGVQAGLAAGMRVLGFCPDGDMQNLKDFGIETFRHMDALLSLLGLDGPR